MKAIELTQGKYALVDDLDYEYLMQWKWRYLQSRHVNGYAARYYYIGSGHATRIHKVVLMHRVIATRMGLDITGQQIDHKNANDPDNKLNNQRSNLRVATNGQNGANQTLRRHNTTGYKGVYQHDARWQARIRAAGQYHYLGTYGTPEEAARAYDMAATAFFCTFAHTNFPVGL
jgi:hypothetical protein